MHTHCRYYGQRQSHSLVVSVGGNRCACYVTTETPCYLEAIENREPDFRSCRFHTETAIWIVQCMCPQNHPILAIAVEPDDERPIEEGIEHLQNVTATGLGEGLVKPRCSICGAPSSEWRYEAGPTPFPDLKTATDALAGLGQQLVQAAQGQGRRRG